MASSVYALFFVGALIVACVSASEEAPTASLNIANAAEHYTDATERELNWLLASKHVRVGGWRSSSGEKMIYD